MATNDRGVEVDGATHISFNTMGKGFNTPAAHLNAIREFAKLIGDYR